MSESELKLQIMNRIAAIEDELILEEIYKMVDREAGLDAVYKLTTDEKKAIDAGLEDIKAGRAYSSEVADKMLKEWLKK